MSNRNEKYVVFSLGKDECFGIDICDVLEIKTSLEFIDIPKKSFPYVKGFANFRHNVITLIDLAQRLEMTICETKISIVIIKDNTLIALDVEKVINIISIKPEDKIIPINEIIGVKENSCLSHVIHLSNNKIISVVDVNRI